MSFSSCNSKKGMMHMDVFCHYFHILCCPFNHGYDTIIDMVIQSEIRKACFPYFELSDQPIERKLAAIIWHSLEYSTGWHSRATGNTVNKNLYCVVYSPSSIQMCGSGDMNLFISIIYV